MDVDSKAMNITWQLSPSSLFSTTSGSGLTANITAQSSACGLGTVTYTFEMPGEEEFTAQKTFWVGVPDYQTDGFQIEGGGLGYESPLPCIYYYDNRRYGVHINKSMDGADWHTWEGMVYPGSLNGSNFEASFIPMDPDPPYYGSGYVMVKGENTCGSSIPVAIGYGPCDYLLSFTPNPSNDETTLSIESYPVYQVGLEKIFII